MKERRADCSAARPSCPWGPRSGATPPWTCPGRPPNGAKSSPAAACRRRRLHQAHASPARLPGRPVGWISEAPSTDGHVAVNGGTHKKTPPQHGLRRPSAGRAHRPGRAAGPGRRQPLPVGFIQVGHLLDMGIQDHPGETGVVGVVDPDHAAEGVGPERGFIRGITQRAGHVEFIYTLATQRIDYKLKY